MDNPIATQKRNGKYLWFAVLGLGFNPETAVSCLAMKTSTKHIILGPTMFEKPNKDAFYIVTHFLLERLNPTRFNELYRHCWPVLNHKADADFRKVTCAWLKEIMEETANAGSKVVASLFLSPGGPKFVSLMLNLANHVMHQEMKTFNTDGSWVPETAALPASSVDMALKRLSLIRTRFLKTAVDQDRFLQEYQRRVQLLVKSMREIRADGAKYDELLKRYSNDSEQDQPSLVEKAKQVRALWSTIEGVLLSTKEDQHSVQCVLKGDVDQYTLDGSERALKISPSLLERIQQLPHQLSSGNVYEGGQLNLLSVLELTNHALQLLKEERSRVSNTTQTQLVPEQLQEKCQQMSRVLQDLYQIRQKLSKEEIPEVKTAIKDMELEWDQKWSDILQHTPLTNFLNEDPALGFLSPMAPLSFEPAAEATCSVFSQYPAKLLERPLQKPTKEDVVTTLNLSNKSLPVEVEDETAVVSSEASSRANTSLDWLFDGPASPTAPKARVKASSAHPMVPKITPMRSKTEIIEMECDNLADQFAEAITTNGATPGRVKGLDLDDLLSTLHGDPFSTRKQLPRTPESLIMDVKSSWRKAIEEGTAEKVRSAKLNESIMGRLTPLGDTTYAFQSPLAHPPTAPKLTSILETTPSICQQGALLKSHLGTWDTFNTTAAMDSPSGTGSSAVQFSLDHETLPEMPSCDSLLSLDDTDMKSEEDSPHLTKHSLQLTTDHSFGSIHLGSDIPALDRDWEKNLVKTDKNADSMKFSLDLDTLDTPSTPNQDYSLPKLITFSPIDDMKC